jgi:hypothetical protein
MTLREIPDERSEGNGLDDHVTFRDVLYCDDLEAGGGDGAV